MENTLGYDELVDTAADVVELTVKVVDAVKDGIQLNDAFLLLAEAKNIEEIVKDAPQALAELKDLTAEEATQASEALALRLNASPGSVIDIVEQSINLLDFTKTEELYYQGYNFTNVNVYTIPE